MCEFCFCYVWNLLSYSKGKLEIISQSYKIKKVHIITLKFVSNGSYSMG